MIRGLWSTETIGWVVAAALLPVVSVTLVTFGVNAALTLAMAFLVATGWQVLFRQTLGTPFSPSGAVTAVALAVLGPPDAELWQTALAASFGLVIGDLVFGGWGRNVVPAPVVALAFAFLSFPNLAPATPDVMIVWASALGGAVLLATGVIDARILTGFAAAFTLTFSLAGDSPAPTGALALGAIILVADPACAAGTRPGRWAHGVLAGSLAALLAWAGPGSAASQPIVFAALLAAIFTPVADYVAIGVAHARRHRAHD